MAKGGLGIRGLGQGALVAVVGAGLFFGLRSLNRGDAGAPTAPSRVITEYRLLSSNSNLAKPPGSSLPIPVLTYELEGPPAELSTVDAALVGKDGRRLRLMREILPEPMPKEAILGLPGQKPSPQPDTATTYRFKLSGYAHAPKSPQLVLSKGERVVYTVPVPELPPPLRTIPLIVPLESESVLTPLDHLDAPDGTWLTQFPYRWKLVTPHPADWGTNPFIVRMEWPGGSSTAFPIDGGGHGFGFSERVASGFAEIRITKPVVKAEAREATLSLEIFDDGSDAGLRVLEPAILEFSDGARVEFLAQSRKIGRDRQGNLRSQVTLPTAIGKGPAGMVSGGWNYTYPLPDSPKPVPGVPPHIVSNRLEFLSPTQEELGIARLEWGTDSQETKPKGPLKIGRFQVRVRVTHAVGFTTFRNRFIRIEPQS